jgi:hypothetical protein
MKPKHFYMELLLRSGDEDSRNYTHRDRNGWHIYVPVYHTWQESPDDLHVYFEHQSTVNAVPYTPYSDNKVTGDYVVPDPNNDDLCFCYSLSFIPHVKRKWLAPKQYISRLKDVWGSPCESVWLYEKQVKKFIKKAHKYKTQSI